MKRMRTKTKAALCSTVRKGAVAEDEEEEERSDSETEKVLL